MCIGHIMCLISRTMFIEEMCNGNNRNTVSITWSRFGVVHKNLKHSNGICVTNTKPYPQPQKVLRVFMPP